MAFINRFSITDCGALTFTGNTLGLSKELGTQNAGTDDSIGAFITLDPTLQVATYPIIPGAGTTLNWQENESAANLNLPADAKVLYAELIWGGTYQSGSVDWSANINDSVNFKTPQGDIFAVAPDPATANSFVFADGSWYMRSANVTALVKDAGAGQYSTGRVVGTVDPLNPFSNHAGWTLAVAYYSASLPVRNLNIFSGAEMIQPFSPVDTTVSGFSTPSTGPVMARILSSAQEGDAIFGGDQMLFGPDQLSLVNLSGPNNPSDNFFASQINNDSGDLDVTGTYGYRNQNPFTNTNIYAGRQGWDITNVDGSIAIQNKQKSATVRYYTTNDRYLVNGLGIQIDAIALLEPTKVVDRGIAEIGDTIIYTVVIPNNSDTKAFDIIFTDPLPPGTTYVPGSFTVDGAPIAGANPTTGVNIGAIDPRDSVIVNFAVTIDKDTDICGTVLDNQAFLDFGFGCTGQRDSAETNIVSTQVECVILEAVKSADTQTAVVGNTITYTVEISNNGTIDAENVVFTDVIPLGATFVPNSFKINNILQPGEDPNVGVNLGTIPAGTSVTVQYQVVVDSVPCPASIVNQATVSYEYRLSSSFPVQTDEIKSNKVIISVFPTSFKQLSVDETVKIPPQKPDAEQIIQVLVDIDIINTRVIRTIKGTSVGGQNLTGYKLVIEGKLNQKVEYVADLCDQSVHAAHFRVPFSTFIVLPEDFDEDSTIEVEPFIEDIYYKLVDKRTVFKNVTFRLLAKFSKN